jgi:hypothetical protein
VLTLEGINEMAKNDNEFINLDKSQEYELKDWLERNELSRSQDNVDELKTIIIDKLKKGDTTKNVKWSELDAAFKNHPSWFSDLAPMEHKK